MNIYEHPFLEISKWGKSFGKGHRPSETQATLPHGPYNRHGDMNRAEQEPGEWLLSGAPAAADCQRIVMGHWPVISQGAAAVRRRQGSTAPGVGTQMYLGTQKGGGALDATRIHCPLLCVTLHQGTGDTAVN